jgi:hypothetical protein
LGAGVVVLSKEFVRKKHCMAELRILLQRCNGQHPRQVLEQAPDQSQQRDQSQQPGGVRLLPVLYGLTVEQLRGMRSLYDSEADWCVDEPKPPPAALDAWAADLRAVAELTLIRQDQVCLLTVKQPVAQKPKPCQDQACAVVSDTAPLATCTSQEMQNIQPHLYDFHLQWVLGMWCNWRRNITYLAGTAMQAHVAGFLLLLAAVQWPHVFHLWAMVWLAGVWLRLLMSMHCSACSWVPDCWLLQCHCYRRWATPHTSYSGCLQCRRTRCSMKSMLFIANCMPNLL